MLTLQRKKLCTTLGIWGAKSFFFRDLGGLSPPSPCVEPPLLTDPQGPRTTVWETLHHTITIITAYRRYIMMSPTFLSSTFTDSHMALAQRNFPGFRYTFTLHYSQAFDARSQQS